MGNRIAEVEAKEENIQLLRLKAAILDAVRIQEAAGQRKQQLLQQLAEMEAAQNGKTEEATA